METSLLQTIINFTKRNIWKLVTNDQLISLQKTVLSESRNPNKLYKLIYSLKNKGYIIELRKWLYYVSYPESGINIDQLIDQWYRILLHELIQKNCKSYYMISWITGLEMHLGQYDIPNNIEILNLKIWKQTTIIGNHEVQWKLIDYNKGSTYKNLHKLFKEHILELTISSKSFSIAPLELCIFETLYYSKKTSGYEIELIKKILKKIKYNLNREIVKSILNAWKYHTSFDRLIRIIWTNDQKCTQRCIEYQKLYSFKW